MARAALRRYNRPATAIPSQSSMRFLPPDSHEAPDLRSNASHLYADVVWYGILAGSTLAFLSVYAAHLGASSFQIGLLTAGPAVVNLLLSLPSGHWLEGKPLVPATFSSSVWNRAVYLALIPLPWVLGERQQVWALVALIVVMSAPGTLLAIAFNALFAEVVPPDWRGLIVGRRNALLAVSLTATSLLCGQLLDRIAFPLDYQVVFGLGALGAALSSYHLGRLRSSAAPAPLEAEARGLMNDDARPGVMRFGDALRLAPGLRFLTRAHGRRLLRLDLLSGDFGRFLGAYLIFYTFQYIPIPLFPLFWVRELQLSDGVISLGNAVFYATMLLASLGLRRLSARIGHRRVLVVGGLSYGVYPLLTWLAHGAGGYWLASLVGGGVWGLLNGGLVNRLMERVPDDDRPGHMALHNLVLNLGILAGSLLGPLAARGLGLRDAILLGAGLRTLAGACLWLWA